MFSISPDNLFSFLLTFAYAEAQELKKEFADVHTTYDKFLALLRSQLESLEQTAASTNPSSSSTNGPNNGSGDGATTTTTTTNNNNDDASTTAEAGGQASSFSSPPSTSRPAPA